MGDGGALTLAKAALDLVQVDPAQAVRAATEASRSARRRGELDAASVAERALGLAAVHLLDMPSAARHLRAAMALAQRQGRPDLAAEARMTFAFALNRYGRPARALSEMEAALTDLSPPSRARGLAQRAAILQQLGRLEEALVDYRAALSDLRRDGDLVWVQRVLLNRGVLHAFRHAYTTALRDLREAEQLCGRLGLSLPAAFVQENLVLVHRRLGDVPTALSHLDRAERLYRSLGAPLGSLLLEGSELKLSVGLVSEAREAAEQAVADFIRTGRHLHTPEARLLLARTAVLDGQPQVGVQHARRAVREFTRQGRVEWVALARCALVLARLDTDNGAAVTIRRMGQAAESADEAERWGWPSTALDVRLAAGRAGLAGPHRTLARRQLELAAARRHRGPAASRVKAWYATALLRRDCGHVTGSNAAAAHGLQILDDYRATMAATDLRARLSGLGLELARLGLRNALEGGCPEEVLAWAERGRSRHLLHRPALPPADPGLSQLLAELRGVVAEQGERQHTGHPVGRLVVRQQELERAIRDATRRQRGQVGPTRLQKPADLLQFVGAALNGATLVEYVELDDRLYAARVTASRTSLHAVGACSRVADLVRWLPFALLRLSRPGTSPASVEAALALLQRVTADLDEILLGPLRDQGEVGGPLVLVPTGPLQSLPWSLLPSLVGCPVAVAPSATLWAAAATRTPHPGPVTVVAGPGLPGAQREALDVAAVYGARPLLGRSATVAAVSAQLQQGSVLHLATHGIVRADNPLFSSLQLFDGPLTVYDLERLDRNPDTVVLAACESGRDVVFAGDEVLGLGATFLSGTTRRVVASVIPVPDAATAPLMVEFHRLLLGGASAADSLAQAQQRLGREHPAAFAAAAGFVCLGAGFDLTLPPSRPAGGPAADPAPMSRRP